MRIVLGHLDFESEFVEEEHGLKKILRWIFPVGLVLVFAVSATGVLCIYALRQAMHDEFVSTKIHDLTDEIHDLVLAAESSQRGYLLTGEDLYLGGFTEALAVTPKKIDELIAIFAENQNEIQNSEQRQIIGEIRNLVQLKFDELKSTIALRSNGKNSKALEIVQSGEGQKLITEFRTKLNAIKNMLKIQ